MTEPRAERRISDEQLEAWLALAEAATPGPWEQDDISSRRVQDEGRGNMVARTMSNEPNPREQLADARFIAAAREAVPALIHELRTMRTAAHEVLEHFWDDYANTREPGRVMLVRAAFLLADQWSPR